MTLSYVKRMGEGVTPPTINHPLPCPCLPSSLGKSASCHKQHTDSYWEMGGNTLTITPHPPLIHPSTHTHTKNDWWVENWHFF